MTTDRRESYRCPIAHIDSPAILRLGNRDEVVHVADQSAGGFTLECEKPPRLKVGQLVTLATGAGCCEAKVIHMTETEDRVKVGLKRLRETKDVSRSMLDAGTAVRLLIIFVLCTVFFAWGARTSAGSFLGEWLSTEQDEPSVSVEPIDPDERARNEQKLAMNMLNLGTLRSSTLASELNLNGEQQQQIFAIVQQTTADLSSLYERRNAITPEDWTDLGLKITQTTSQEIQNVMTDDQHRKWQEFLGRQALKTGRP